MGIADVFRCRVMDCGGLLIVIPVTNMFVKSCLVNHFWTFKLVSTGIHIIINGNIELIYQNKRFIGVHVQGDIM